MLCLLPFKANTAKQQQTRHKEAASDNTNSTLIGSEGSGSAAEVARLSIAFSVLIDGEFDWWKRKLPGGGGGGGDTDRLEVFLSTCI